MQAVAGRQAAAFRSGFTDRVMDVLFEGGAKGPEGLTGNYIRVYCPGMDVLPGEIRPVRLGRPFRDGLKGCVAD